MIISDNAEKTLAAIANKNPRQGSNRLKLITRCKTYRNQKPKLQNARAV